MSCAGMIADNTTGNVACDMYNRWEQDIALMKSLGIKNYRWGTHAAYSKWWQQQLPWQ